MLEREDMQAISLTVLEMIEERVTEPLQNLFDCLIFELIAQNSVDIARLAERLESLWQAMPEHAREGCGHIYNRYRRLLGNPELFAAGLQPPPSDPRSGERLRPDWLRGVLDGQGDQRQADDPRDEK